MKKCKCEWVKILAMGMGFAVLVAALAAIIKKLTHRRCDCCDADYYDLDTDDECECVSVDEKDFEKE